MHLLMLSLSFVSLAQLREGPLCIESPARLIKCGLVRGERGLACHGTGRGAIVDRTGERERRAGVVQRAFRFSHTEPPEQAARGFRCSPHLSTIQTTFNNMSHSIHFCMRGNHSFIFYGMSQLPCRRHEWFVIDCLFITKVSAIGGRRERLP